MPSTVAVPGDAAAVSVTQDGAHALDFRAADVAQNVAAAQTVAIRIDRVPPKVTLSVTPTTLKLNNKLQAVGVGGSATDSTSGVASTVITVTDRFGAVIASNVRFGSTVSLLASKNQVYTFTAIATDVAGNASAPVTATVTVK